MKMSFWEFLIPCKSPLFKSLNYRPTTYFSNPLPNPPPISYTYPLHYSPSTRLTPHPTIYPPPPQPRTLTPMVTHVSPAYAPTTLLLFLLHDSPSLIRYSAGYVFYAKFLRDCFDYASDFFALDFFVLRDLSFICTFFQIHKYQLLN